MIPHPFLVYRAARFAFRKKAKPKDTMEAPTNRARRGLPVTMSHTTPTPETRASLALVSRLETVGAELSVKIPPFAKICLSAWMREQESNLRLRQTTPVCYLYTIPHYLELRKGLPHPAPRLPYSGGK